MSNDRVLTQEAFDRLLAWLDADRDRAGEKYETIRRALIKIFTTRGCSEPERLSDETITRVSVKLAQIDQYQGDKTLYFYGVAKMIVHEDQRHPRVRQTHLSIDSATGIADPGGVDEDIELEYQCLEDCLQQQSEDNRDLVLRYFQTEGKPKAKRKQLAEDLGITVGALRIRVCRLRHALEQCVTACLQGIPAN